MACPAKKREVHRNRREDGDDSDNASSATENINKVMEIQVDFEGRNPQDSDFHGIKTLLRQLFLKAHVDLGGLTDLIIKQNYVGSVIKQSQDEEMSDDDNDDDENSVNDVYGITTVINLEKDVPCLKQLRELLLKMAIDHASDTTISLIKKALDTNLGLLINERFVNIPARISIPLLENLMSEMRRATKKGMKFDFSFLVLISKIYKPDQEDTRDKRKRKDQCEEPDIFWSNPEEEIFAEAANTSFEFSVEAESDSGISGTWTESDKKMTPYRRVLLIEASKLQSIVDNIKNEVK